MRDSMNCKTDIRDENSIGGSVMCSVTEGGMRDSMNCKTYIRDENSIGGKCDVLCPLKAGCGII